MEETHHQYSGGYAVWTCYIINTEEGVQYMTTKLLKGYLLAVFIRKKYYFTDNITQISSYCDEFRCF